MLDKTLILVMFIAGFATADTNSQANQCTEGDCEYRDSYSIMSQLALDKRATKLLAKDLIKLLYKADQSQIKAALVKQEIEADGIIFKLNAPYEIRSNVDGKMSGFHIKYEDANFFMNTSPVFYTKKFNEDLYLHCSFDSVTNDVYKMLVFRKCKVVSIK